MYSNIKSVQILCSLLKQFDIRDIIISPGGTNIPLVHSIETDSFFTCYSVVDERSAAYFAIGVSQGKNRPVACICTSGTAAANYLPGITEAFYQSVPVIAITCDKNPYYLNQLETQKIPQYGMLDPVVKYSVNLPIVKSKEDEWLCNRLVNEALLECGHHGFGPVHINIPLIGSPTKYDCKELPQERRMRLIDAFTNDIIWRDKASHLAQCQKIMFVVGQNVVFDEKTIELMNAFFERFNCFFAVENLSNIDCNGRINTYAITETANLDQIPGLLPDLVISVGNNLAAYNLKLPLRRNYQKIENWLISENGKVRDAYKSLTNIYECPLEYFLGKMLSFSQSVNNKKYYSLWSDAIKKVKFPKTSFTSFEAGKMLSGSIPSNSLVHTAILGSTRIMQLFDRPDLKCYSNVGALGIDGCLSTFLGQAFSVDQLAYLLIGDLSFFYDMNAAGINSIKNNVRIILLNNSGGSEFHFFVGRSNIPTIDQNIAAQHRKIAKGWIQSLNFDYYEATDEKSLETALQILAKPSDKPQFLEVFLDAADDAAVLNQVFRTVNEELIPEDTSFEHQAKKMAKKILSEEQIQKLRKVIKK